MTRLEYHVERFSPVENVWDVVWETKHRSQGYCHGYVDALDSVYPSLPHRVVCTANGVVKYETKGRGTAGVTK